MGRSGLLCYHCIIGEVYGRAVAPAALRGQKVADHHPVDTASCHDDIQHILCFHRHLPVSACTVLLVPLRPGPARHRQVQRQGFGNDPDIHLIRHQHYIGLGAGLASHLHLVECQDGPPIEDLRLLYPRPGVHVSFYRHGFWKILLLTHLSSASMATIIRAPYAKELLSDPDYLYNFTDLAIWSTIEIGLGLTASALATLKPLFRKLKVLVVTKSGTVATGTLPQYRSRPSNSRVRSGSIFQGTNRDTRKLQKTTSTVGGPAIHGWTNLDDKRSAPEDAYELSLHTETSSVRTTITANHSMDQGCRLSPPPPLHPNSFKRTSVSIRISHVEPPATGSDSSV